MADVHHENLVRLGELACDEGHWYFTMELVRGKELIEYVCPNHRYSRPPSELVDTPSRPHFDESRLRHTLAQLAAALAAIHAAGHVHRDVKPSNVLVLPNGRVVLLDFGLVTAVGPTRTPDAPWLVGSPDFMSPEQIELGGVGPPADCYAVGVMLFLALTGKLPFEGSPFEIMEAKLARAAPVACDLVEGIPADLNALCVDLLNDAPARRPDAAAIRARLGVAISGNDITNAPHATFVGRDRELGALHAALKQTSTERRSRIVVVEGDPGMGKSALVRQFLKSVSAHTLVLTGRCYEQETVPFKGVDAIVDALTAHLVALADDEVDAILAGGVRYLATVFKVLERVPVIAQMTSRLHEIATPSAVREQAFAEFERLLHALARRSPLVLFLDDLQWCDRDSVTLFRRSMPSATDVSCFFVTTMRPSAEVHPELSELLADATRISLTALSEAEAYELWCEVTGDEKGTAPLDPKQRNLIREAAGHPIFVTELARSARSGTLACGSAVSLQDVLWHRIQERDPVDRRLLQMLAIAGIPTPYEVLARAAGTEVGDCQVRIAGLRAAQLIQVSRQGEDRLIEPYHTRITESLLLHLDEERDAEDSVAARHLRFGWALLEATKPEALDRRLFSIVRHLNASSALVTSREELVRIASLNLAACRRARLATAYEQARDYAHSALALLGAGGWNDAYELTKNLHAEGMAAETFAGNFGVATSLFQTALRCVTSRADKAKLVNLRVELETSVDHLAEAIVAGREGLRDLGVHLAEDPAEIDRRIGEGIATMQSHLANVVIEDLARLPEIADEEKILPMTILYQLAPAAIQSQPRLFVSIALIMFDLTMVHGATPSACKNFVDCGIIRAGMLGDYDSAYRLGKVAFALLERYAPSPLESSVHFVFGGYISHWRAHYREGLSSLVEAERKGLETGDVQHVAYAHVFHVLRLFLVGQPLDECQERADAAAVYLKRARTLIQLPGVEFVARVVAQLRGKAADAARPELSDDEFTTRMSKTDKAHRFNYGQARLAVSYILGDFAEADRWDAYAATYARAGGSLFSLPDYVLFQSLLMAKKWDHASESERAGLLKRLTENQTKLKTWADHCPANFLHKYQLASAEIARVRGASVDEIIERYAEAVSTMGREFVHIRALATELQAALSIDQNRPQRAAALLRDAYSGYQRWGAEAKLRQLERVYGNMLAPSSRLTDAHGGTQNA